MSNKVTYLPLGGAGSVTLNMHVFETDHDIVIFDAGIGFPDTDQFGVDVVIPDTTYLESRRHKIRGIVISHSHEDHIGGLPYLLKNLGNPPIYATKLARAFIQNKLSEHNMVSGQALNEIFPETTIIHLGDFTITPYRVNHSVPDALGLFIHTPAGNIVYSPDFKFDWTPVDGVLFEVGKLSKLIEPGVAILLSDCLGANREGYTESERMIQKVFEDAIAVTKGQVFITTMSSNISRMQQAINASFKHGRKVIPVGRSIDQNIQTAINLGYLTIPNDIVISIEESRRIPPHKATYIIAGSFGQKGSALDRLSRGENRQIRIKENATVIFSADPIPGVYDQVALVVDNLIALGANVIYSDIQDNVHVSGHGSRGDLSMMAGIVRPKYFIPIGGEIRHQRGYRDMVTNMGFKEESVFELAGGQAVNLVDGEASLGEKIEIKSVFVDGGLVGDVGTTVLKERMQLASEGVIVIVVRKDKDQFNVNVDIDSRGFVFKSGNDKLMQDIYRFTKKIIAGRKVNEWNKAKEELDKKISNFIYQQIKRKPLVLPVLVNA